MEPTKQDAEAMLKDAGEIETAVRARAPQEYPLYVGMGLTILLIGLAVDLNDAGGVASVVGATLVLVALAVTVGTNVRLPASVPAGADAEHPEVAGVGARALERRRPVLLGILLDGTIGFSFTLGGIVGAVPFLLWAQRLRRTA